MDVKELRRLLRLMKDFELSELEIEEEGLRVRLRRGVDGIPMSPFVAAPAAAPAPGPAPGAEPEAPERPSDLLEITSPMVGSFYRRPAPDQDPYAQVGDKVGSETVVCIIEAMKVMNEIKAEIEGEILEILVNDGEAVEFGQPLFLVRPSGI